MQCITWHYSKERKNISIPLRVFLADLTFHLERNCEKFEDRKRRYCNSHPSQNFELPGTFLAGKLCNYDTGKPSSIFLLHNDSYLQIFVTVLFRLGRLPTIWQKRLQNSYEKKMKKKNDPNHHENNNLSPSLTFTKSTSKNNLLEL